VNKIVPSHPTGYPDNIITDADVGIFRADKVIVPTVVPVPPESATFPADIVDTKTFRLEYKWFVFPLLAFENKLYNALLMFSTLCIKDVFMSSSISIDFEISHTPISNAVVLALIVNKESPIYSLASIKDVKLHSLISNYAILIM